MEDGKKNNKKLFIIIGGVLLLLAILAPVYFIFLKKDSNSEIDNNYIYKIRYDFGLESYIYLYPNKVLKRVEISDVYEVSKDCDCMEPTGKKDTKITEVKLSESAKNVVISELDRMYYKYKLKEYDADKLDLTKDQQRLLLGVMLDDEDMIMINIDLIIDNERTLRKVNGHNVEIEKSVVKSRGQNETLNKIAEYLNNELNSKYKELENKTNNVNNETKLAIKMRNAYTGPYSISFVMYVEGTINGTNVDEMKGYTFKYTGEINTFDAYGIRDRVTKSAIDNFMNSDTYKNNYKKLYTNWDVVLKEKMYETGNWYLADGKVIYIIDSNLIGLDIGQIELEGNIEEDI